MASGPATAVAQTAAVHDRPREALQLLGIRTFQIRWQMAGRTTAGNHNFEARAVGHAGPARSRPHKHRSGPHTPPPGRDGRINT